MSLTAFPEPKDLEVDFVNRIGDSRPKTFQEHNVSNPHPNFGKDPNILNEFGHTEYPKMIYPDGPQGAGVVVKSREEEKARMEDKLKTDGPTIEEWVANGYKADKYPPEGYASKSSEEKIKSYIEADNKAPTAKASW